MTNSAYGLVGYTYQLISGASSKNNCLLYYCIMNLQDDRDREHCQTQALVMLVFEGVLVPPYKSVYSMLYSQQTLLYHSNPGK